MHRSVPRKGTELGMEALRADHLMQRRLRQQLKGETLEAGEARLQYFTITTKQDRKVFELEAKV